jgi:hypothetical protein
MEKVAPNIFWDQLLQLIAEGRVIPILGRDLLKVRYQNQETLLYPLLGQLLAEYLRVSGEDLTEGAEINDVVYRYLSQDKNHRVEEIYSALTIVMPKEHELTIPDPLTKLTSIHTFKLFVTTTFDSLLERALTQSRYPEQTETKIFSYHPNDVKDLDISLEKMEGRAIFHLFGKLSATPAYAVTQEDILEFIHSLQDKSHQPAGLIDELDKANLLILGCSFGEWLARFFIRAAKRERLRKSSGSTDYVADARISSDENLVLFLRHFSHGTKIYEGGSALHFIDELHKRWIQRFPNKEKSVEVALSVQASSKVKEGDIREGAVFLSYMREDESAAMNINIALEKAKIDVFFDTKSLHVGDNWEVKIKHALAKCSLFIPVVSQNTLTKEFKYFRREWRAAIDREKEASWERKFLLPVVIDDTSMESDALPDKFRDYQWQKLPNGEVTSDFIDRVRQLYRKYQIV